MKKKAKSKSNTIHIPKRQDKTLTELGEYLARREGDTIRLGDRIFPKSRLREWAVDDDFSHLTAAFHEPLEMVSVEGLSNVQMAIAELRGAFCVSDPAGVAIRLIERLTKELAISATKLTAYMAGVSHMARMDIPSMG